MRYLVAILLFSVSLSGLERGEAILIGDTYTREHWSCTTANTTGASQSCPSAYTSYYSVGNYIGVPYKWGGFDSMDQFRHKISQGYGAGSYSSDGVLSCVTGVDCSGYVSRCWAQTSKYGTSTIHGISSELASTAEMKKADAFNKAGSHVVMLTYYHRDGSPVIMEAAGGSYRKTVFRKTTWSYLNGYKPIRYDNIENDTNVVGTISNPIKIQSFPFTDSGNTRNVFSLEIDSYSVKPETPETGPEVIYTFTIENPGTIDLSVTDIQAENIDNDIHLLSSLNVDSNRMATDALARDDHSIIMHIDAGTYYIVVDSYSSSGNDRPGEYTMTASFEADEIIIDDDETPDNSVDENTDPDDETPDNSVDDTYPDYETSDESTQNDESQTVYDEITPDEDNAIGNDTAVSTDEEDQTTSDDDEISKESSGCGILIL